MNPSVVLFDIDGTLIDCGGAGRRAMALAFEQQFGRADACASIAFGGMTDRAIIRAALVGLGIAEIDPAAVDALIELYLSHLTQSMPTATSFRELAGARAVAEACRRELGLAVGLGTGNVRQGARLKLERFGLWSLFAFGGFGCDAEDRAELLAKGRERGAAWLDLEPADVQVLVVGDTPKDVHAAHAIGAHCLGVATGRFSAEELHEAGADEVVASLESREAWRAIRAFAQR